MCKYCNETLYRTDYDYDPDEEMFKSIDKKFCAQCGTPVGEVKPLTVEQLNERTTPVWCDVPNCLCLPDGGYYCLCQNGTITPPSGHSFSVEKSVLKGWKLFDRPNCRN